MRQLHLLLRRTAWLLITVITLAGCSTTPPEGMTAVAPFDVARYTGKWFEVARLDHSFERGLSDVSATYTAQPDGSIKVVNRGFDTAKNEWNDVVGKALFIGDTTRASLKVSFFGPFYGGYHVVALDPQYRWAMVVGPNRGYLWILSRDKQLAADVRERLIQQAQALGLPTEQLIWVAQTRSDG